MPLPGISLRVTASCWFRYLLEAISAFPGANRASCAQWLCNAVAGFGQWSVVNGPRAEIGDRWSKKSAQESALRLRRNATEDWSRRSGRQGAGRAKWAVGGGQWSEGGGRTSNIEHRTSNNHQPTANIEPSQFAARRWIPRREDDSQTPLPSHALRTEVRAPSHGQSAFIDQRRLIRCVFVSISVH